MGFFGNIGKTLSDAGQATLQKGKEMADTAKFNGMISDEEKKLSGYYEQIGRKYVELFGEPKEEAFVELIENIKVSNQKIEECRQEIKKIKGVIRCQSCGAELPQGTLFCSVCGTKIEQEQPQPQQPENGTFCTKCGAPMQADSNFCTACGAKVEQNPMEAVQENVEIPVAEPAQDNTTDGMTE